MSRKKIIIFSGIIILFILASLYIVLRRDDDPGEEMEIGDRVYHNEELGYAMNFPTGWNVEEIESRDLDLFHDALSEERILEDDFFRNNYSQAFGINLVGDSPLTHIDGTISYNIKKHVYLNREGFSLREWYDIAVLAEAFSSGRIRESVFIRTRRQILEEERDLPSEKYIYDPWMPRGKIVDIAGRDALKVTFPGDRRYEGYQYYITLVDDYIFVFHFGYGGPVVPREMWERTARHVEGMIYSIEVL